MKSEVVHKRTNLLLEDPKFRIRPLQQVVSACTGALITACFMTPLDVVKTRLQAQQTATNKCFLYCNGLMDHICPCDPNMPSNLKPEKRLNGTIVCKTKRIHTYVQLIAFITTIINILMFFHIGCVC
uniref:Solute carrier family 25 member 40 n=1 Tax=Bactrocera latifrons TaxID=174628 RepID=A0A0K8U9R4_BACLA